MFVKEPLAFIKRADVGRKFVHEFYCVRTMRWLVAMT